MLNRNSHAGLHTTAGSRYLVLTSFDDVKHHPYVEVFVEDAFGWKPLLCERFDAPAVDELLNRVHAGELPRTVPTPQDLPFLFGPVTVMKPTGPWWRRPSVIASRSRDPRLTWLLTLARIRTARKMAGPEVDTALMR